MRIYSLISNYFVCLFVYQIGFHISHVCLKLCVAKNDQKFLMPPAFSSHMLGLEVCTAMPGLGGTGD